MISSYYLYLNNEQGIKLSNLSIKEIIEALKIKLSNKFNAYTKTRILELEDLLRNLITPFSAPFQIDMKNNAIQHAATIANHEEAIIGTGVLPQQEHFIPDSYTKIAEDVLHAIHYQYEVIS
jgi:hypothetical protein